MATVMVVDAKEQGVRAGLQQGWCISDAVRSRETERKKRESRENYISVISELISQMNLYIRMLFMIT